MNPFVAFGMLFWIVIFALACCWPLVAFLAYRRLAGIERALWAIRSELERARPAPPREAPAAHAAPDTAFASGPQRVSNSIFGR